MGGSEKPRSIMLLGSGELGREVALRALGYGLRVIAVDRYDDAPAMQVAHAREVISMLDGAALQGVVRTHRPDLVIPEFEGIRAEALVQLEEDGFTIVPTAEAAVLSLDRRAMREVAASELGLRTPAYAYASSEEELALACDKLGYPVVVKPLMTSGGRGQSTVTGPAKVEVAWAYAQEGGRGDEPAVIAEELIPFEVEITLVTVRERNGTIHLLEPIAHRQDRGDLREAWLPAGLRPEQRAEIEAVSRTVTERLGGVGVFGVEFFVTDEEVVFSEVTPRPHDTGFVTLLSHDRSQFDLYMRALLGLPIPTPAARGPTACAVILADRDGTVTGYRGLQRAMEVEGTEVCLFGKPEAYPFRRMGVALATGATVKEARARALEAASRIQLELE